MDTNNLRCGLAPGNEHDSAIDRDSPIHSFLSPEAVRLDLPVSGPAPRMLAYGIDVAIMFVFMILLFTFMIMSMHLGAVFENSMRHAVENAKVNPNRAPLGALPGLIMALAILAEFIIETGYFIFWEMVSGGRSPGKMLVGLRVVRRNGMPIDFRASVLRNLMRIADILPAEYLVGLISILLSKSGERLGDHVAGTIVARIDRPEAAPEISLDNVVVLALTRDQIARIGPRELQLIRTVLRRSQGLPENRSALLLAEAADAMRKRLDITEMLPPDNLAFLRNLLATAERSLRSG